MNKPELLRRLEGWYNQSPMEEDDDLDHKAYLEIIEIIVNCQMKKNKKNTNRIFILDSSKKDISDDVKIINEKSNPFGWSCCDLEHKGKIIGFIESGNINLNDEYSYKKERTK